MSSIEEELKTFICADEAVAALIRGRMYPVVVAHDALRPFVAYARTGTDRIRTHSGYGGLTTVRMRLSCWAGGYDAAMTLADAVRARIDNIGKSTWGELIITRCFVTDENDVVELSPELIEHRVFGRNLDVEIAFKES